MKRVMSIAVILSVTGPVIAAQRHNGFISRGRGNETSNSANQVPGPHGGQMAAPPKNADEKKDSAPPAETPTTEPSFVAGQAEVQKANAQLTAVVAKLRGNFEQSQDFKDALAEQQQAHSDLAVAEKAVADSLAGNPQYEAAVETRKDAEAKLASARIDAPDSVPQLATETMKARAAVKDMEKTLGGKNDAMVAAKNKADAADQKVAKLRAGFEASMKSDPDYVSAKAALDAARGVKTASAK